MSSVGVKEAKAGLSELVDEAASGEFVTITRHGKQAAVLVSVEAAEAAKRALARDRPSLLAHLKPFPADVDLDDEVFARNRGGLLARSSCERVSSRYRRAVVSVTWVT